YFGQTTVNKKGDHQWFLQGGISKNWFGYGATSIYGEYAVSEDYGADLTNATGTTLGRDYLAPVNTTGFTPVRGVTATELRTWGFGVAQSFNPGPPSFPFFATLVRFAPATFFLGSLLFDPDTGCPALLAAAFCSGGVWVTAAPGAFAIHKL